MKEKYEVYLSRVGQINHLLYTISQDTKFDSSPKPILEHKDFKTLKAMGEKIISYIFFKGIHTGWSLVLLTLLHEITGEDPIPKEHAGKFCYQVKYWIEWYLNSKYYPSDVYHGLVNS